MAPRSNLLERRSRERNTTRDLDGHSNARSSSSSSSRGSATSPRVLRRSTATMKTTPRGGGSSGSSNVNGAFSSVCCFALATALLSVVFPLPAEAKDAMGVSAGFQHSCVVTSGAQIKCFGSNKNGQLGTGDGLNYGNGASTSGGMGDDLPAVSLGTAVDAAGVSASWSHTCALLSTGTAKCWGRNDWGQLGKGDYIDRGDDPLLMGDSLAEIDLGTGPSGDAPAVAIQVTTGQQFTCILVEGGQVKCFGRNDEGQCGRGNLDENVGSNGEEDMGDALPYVDLGTGVEAISISSGTAYTCAALLGGGIKCWGSNAYGSLGVGDSYNRGDEPSELGDNLPEVDLGTGEVGIRVYAGLRHACAIVAGGGVKCWGDNRSGQLGLGHVDTIGDGEDEMGDKLPFLSLGTGATASSLSLGESHTCTVLAGGAGVKCWGKGFNGELGSGEYRARGKFGGELGNAMDVTDLGTGATALTIAAGSDHTCATMSDGSLKCWGLNTVGALGQGDTKDRGDEAGEMGDDLAVVNLGTNVTVALEDMPTFSPTPSPTPPPTTGPPTLAPTISPTKALTLSPVTPPPSSAAVVEASPSPTSASRGVIYNDTPSPDAANITTAPVERTPAPPTPAPTTDGVMEEGNAEDDGGLLSASHIEIGLYVAAPILAFALVACLCARRRYHRRDLNSASIWARGSVQKQGAPSGPGGLVASGNGNGNGNGNGVGPHGAVTGSAVFAATTADGASAILCRTPSTGGGDDNAITSGGSRALSGGTGFGVSGGGGEGGELPVSSVARVGLLSGARGFEDVSLSGGGREGTNSGSGTGQSNAPSSDEEGGEGPSAGMFAMSPAAVSARSSSNNSGVFPAPLVESGGIGGEGGGMYEASPAAAFAENGWFASETSAPPKGEERGGMPRILSLRGRNSDRILARAMHAGRPANRPRGEVHQAIAAAAQAADEEVAASGPPESTAVGF